MNNDDSNLIFDSRLRKYLDSVYERLKTIYVETSVLGAVREYVPKSSVDQELWALFCSLLNFQTPVISWLNPMLKGLSKNIESHGLKFIDIIYDIDYAKQLLLQFGWDGKRGFRHRILKLNDVLILFKAMTNLIEEGSSLRNIIEELYEVALERKEPMEYVIKKFAEIFRMHFPRNYRKLGNLVPDPYGNSAFKRLNLFFRWMVRPYPDLGVWGFIDKRYLLVSLDTGILRTVNRVFNMKLKEYATWNNVLKITELFRKINPDDPAKYDYVFSRPAIMKYCIKDSAKNKCYLCPLSEICTSAKIPLTFKTRARMSEEEEKVLNEFLALNKNKYDYIGKEVQLGNRRVDAILHDKQCKWYVVEVERELNYTAIGQAVAYRRIFKEIYRKTPEAIILCRKAPHELKTACTIDANIEVIIVPTLSK